MPEIATWIEERRKASALQVSAIPLSECQGWSLRDGKLVHQTGGFFSIRGCRFQSSASHLNDLWLPMIDQPEVGLLGFVVRKGKNGWEWLLQAKTEPGSVGGTQVGPSVQATRSNWLRRHGGKATPMLNLFEASSSASKQVSDGEQSEQGDRFLAKYNRNAVVLVDDSLEAPEGAWQWFAAHQLLKALGEDTLINTDSRSVLWCSDWSLLLEPGQSVPFLRWQGRDGFGEALLNSSRAGEADNEDATGYRRAINALELKRQQCQVHVEDVPLDSIRGWILDDNGLHPEQAKAGASIVKTVAVHTTDREVASWCQPMLESTEEQKVILLCAIQEGVLQLAFSLSCEPGFREGVQFAPSLVSGPGHAHPGEWMEAAGCSSAVVRAATRQSDEGGRFLHSVALYQLIEVPPSWVETPVADGLWVTVAAARRMATMPGVLNNELRSVLSMLLTWL